MSVGKHEINEVIVFELAIFLLTVVYMDAYLYLM